MLLSVSAVAATGTKIITFDATCDLGSIDNYNNAGPDQVSKDGITISISNGCLGLGQHYRIYAHQTLTVNAPSQTITSIQFVCTANGADKWGPGNLSISDGSTGTYTYDAEGVNGYWTGSASTVTFDTNRQTRCYYIKVGLAAPAGMYVIGDIYAENGSKTNWDPSLGIALTETSTGVYTGTFKAADTGIFALTGIHGSSPSDWDTVNANRWYPVNATGEMTALGIGYQMTREKPSGSSTADEAWIVPGETTYNIKVDTNTGYVWVGKRDVGACYIMRNDPSTGTYSLSYQNGWPLTQTSPNVYEGYVDFRYLEAVDYTDIYFNVATTLNESDYSTFTERYCWGTAVGVSLDVVEGEPLAMAQGAVTPWHLTEYPTKEIKVTVDFNEGTITVGTPQPHLYILGYLRLADGTNVHMVANQGVAIYETSEAGVYQGEVELIWGYSGGFLITEKLGNDRYDWDTVNANRWWPTTADAVYMETLGIGYPATRNGSVGSWAVAEEGIYTIKVDTNTGYVYVGENDPGSCVVNLFTVTPTGFQPVYSLPMGQSEPNVFEGELNPAIIARYVAAGVDVSTLVVGVNANRDYQYSSVYTWGGTTDAPQLALGANSMLSGGSLWSIVQIVSAATANPTEPIKFKADFNNAVFTVGDALKGDLNGDGSVDGSDVSILLEMVLAGGLSDAQIVVADLNGDGSVDGSDVSILLEIVLAGE